MNGVITLSSGETVRIETDAEGNTLATWPERSTKWWGVKWHTRVKVDSVAVERNKPVILTLANGAVVKTLDVVERIVCTSRTLGEYEASGLWAGTS